MIKKIDVNVQDIGKEEKGFFRAIIEAEIEPNHVLTVSDCGRGAARSIAFAMKKFGDTVLKMYPEYPEQKETKP